MWKDVYADFSDLPRREQKKLFNLIKEEFFSDDEEEMKDAITAIRETRFNEGLACVHCGWGEKKREIQKKGIFHLQHVNSYHSSCVARRKASAGRIGFGRYFQSI